jgi:hypothetical protein
MMTTIGDQTKKRRFFSRWRVQAALWLSLFVVSFNVYVMTVVIVPITRDLGANIASVQSALVLVSLVMASFVATSENLGAQEIVYAWPACFFGRACRDSSLPQRPDAVIGVRDCRWRRRNADGHPALDADER